MRESTYVTQEQCQIKEIKRLAYECDILSNSDVVKRILYTYDWSHTATDNSSQLAGDIEIHNSGTRSLFRSCSKSCGVQSIVINCVRTPTIRLCNVIPSGLNLSVRKARNFKSLHTMQQRNGYSNGRIWRIINLLVRLIYAHHCDFYCGGKCAASKEDNSVCLCCTAYVEALNVMERSQFYISR